MRCLPAVSLCLLLAPAALTGCGSRPSPDGANAAEGAPVSGGSPAAASGTDSTAAAAVVAIMHRVYDGFANHDTATINAAVRASGMIYVDPSGVALVTSPGGTTEMVKQCSVRSYAMDSVLTSTPAPDFTLLSFKLTIDETCGGQKSPSPDYVMSTWQRQGGTWRAVAFSATPAAAAR